MLSFRIILHQPKSNQLPHRRHGDRFRVLIRNGWTPGLVAANWEYSGLEGSFTHGIDC
jgi:hypothetical protein